MKRVFPSKLLVAILCLSGLVLSSLRVCSAAACMRVEKTHACCAQKAQTSQPENSKRNLLCCDQPRISAATAEAMHLGTVSAPTPHAPGVPNSPLLTYHAVYYRRTTAVSVIGPPDAFDHATPTRAPPAV